MPLPDKVIEQLGREPPRTPGWSLGVIMFSGSLLFIVILLYAGLTFGYEPYLNAQVSKTQAQVNQLSQSVSATDQGKLIGFYSQLSNLRTLLKSHVLFSQFLSWIEKNTEANVSFDTLSFASGNQITLAGTALTQGDLDQQLAVFESSPQVQKVSVSTVSASQTGPGWSFNLTLTMDPTLFARSGI